MLWARHVYAWKRRLARTRRGVADRTGHHVAEAVSKSGNVSTRAGKAGPAALLGGTPTEHAKEIHHPRFALRLLKVPVARRQR